MDLETRFLKTMSTWSQDTTHIMKQWQTLQKHYNEDFRAYHNLSHLTEIFRYFDTYYQALEYPNEVAYAVFYHDSIYNIYSRRNELNSAELALEHLQKTTANDASTDRVYQLIMATKHHTSNGHSDVDWMIDFDLGILGQPWSVYERYITQIRQEYAIVPDFLFHKGRRKVLQMFLGQERIYKTDTFFNRLETTARENLDKELQRL